MWIQKEISLNPRPRGFHLTTDEILQNLQEIGDISIGTMEIFITHTKLNDFFTLRFCIGQTHTDIDHIKLAWELIKDGLERVKK